MNKQLKQIKEDLFYDYTPCSCLNLNTSILRLDYINSDEYSSKYEVILICDKCSKFVKKQVTIKEVYKLEYN